MIAEQGWGTDVRVHGVFSRWDHLVGRDVAQHCRPEAFSDGKLRVRTDSTAWATQMRLLAPTVLRRLNEELGDGTVTLIDVQGPSGPTWRKGPGRCVTDAVRAPTADRAPPTSPDGRRLQDRSAARPPYGDLAPPLRGAHGCPVRPEIGLPA